MKLEGAFSLVTGSALRVGKAIALELAERGSNIILHYNTSQEAAEATKQEIEALDVTVFMFQVDLQQVKAIEQFARDLAQTIPRLDVLVNSASSFLKTGLLESTEEDWDTSINVNTKAPLFLTKYLQPLLAKAEDPLIVNIGDLSSRSPWRGFAAHSISKSALMHLTQVSARELAPKIRVNGIVPGLILPPAHMTEDSKRWLEMKANVPLQRSGSPNDIAATVVYLASVDFITGVIIPVDGGESLRGAVNH